MSIFLNLIKYQLHSHTLYIHAFQFLASWGPLFPLQHSMPLIGIRNEFGRQHDLQQASVHPEHQDHMAHEVWTWDGMGLVDSIYSMLCASYHCEPNNQPSTNTKPAFARLHIEKGTVQSMVPVRPTAALAGGVSLQSKQVIQLL